MNIDKVTIASIDSVNMYPSIKLTTINRPMRYFTKILTTGTKKTIILSLEIILLGMSSTLISFDGEYYEYHWE